MKYFLNISFLLLTCSILSGQNIQVIEQGSRTDSSYYHICKISDNEFWLGGEYGILKKVDSLGNLSNINLPNQGVDILKIEKIKRYVFILTADAVIYRYDIESDTFITKQFPAFRNRCFYDIIELNNDQLLVCGGATGIAAGRPTIPKGFIATLDLNLENIDVVWKHRWKFVWSIIQTDNQETLAVTFNGLRSRILKTKDLTTWKKAEKIKGLIHDVSYIDDQLWYCGTKNISFRKNGIFGKLDTDHKLTKVKRTGCLWRLDTIDKHIVSVTYSGELLKIDPHSREITLLSIPKKYALYDIEQISNSQVLVVGRGKMAYLVDVEAFAESQKHP